MANYIVKLVMSPDNDFEKFQSPPLPLKSALEWAMDQMVGPSNWDNWKVQRHTTRRLASALYNKGSFVDHNLDRWYLIKAP